MTEARIEGLDVLGRRLKALPQEIAGKNGGPLLKALRRMGKTIQTAAKAKVPVRTGALRDNIIVVRKRKDRLRSGEEGVDVTVRARFKTYVDSRGNRQKKRVGAQYKVYGALYYARFIEFGTSKMTSEATGHKPFMRPAFEETKGRLGEMFRSELSRAIDDAVRKLERTK